eukprot:6987313-Lingulodinium_polyedra.AAC.1
MLRHHSSSQLAIVNVARARLGRRGKAIETAIEGVPRRYYVISQALHSLDHKSCVIRYPAFACPQQQRDPMA